METEILLEVKPKYVNYVRFFCNPGIEALLLIFVFSMLSAVPGIALLLSELLQIRLLTVSISLILLSLVFLSLIFSIILYFNEKNFEATIYRVYADRIEFEEGFINHKYTTIKMTDIKEIHLVENFIQRKADLGSIKFITAANNSTSSTGVCFQDIQNSKVVYAKIKQIHENK